MKYASVQPGACTGRLTPHGEALKRSCDTMSLYIWSCSPRDGGGTTRTTG